MWNHLLQKTSSCVMQVAASRLFNASQGPRWIRCVGRPAGLVPAANRTYRKDAASTVELPINPVTVTEIKQYLRSKDLAFQDGYSCLHIQSIFLEAAARSDTFSLFIDKTTGQFLCKDTLVEGSWEDLQDCVEVMQKENQDFLSPHVLLRYSGSMEEQEEQDRELREVQRIWSSSVPLGDVPEEEVQQIKAMFQV